MKLALSLVGLVALCNVMTLHSYASEEPVAVPDARLQSIQAFKRTGLSTTSGDAMTLEILVSSSGFKRGIEVGTERGYGAMHMGTAFERNRGQLFTFEIDAQFARQARENLKNAGLDKVVTVVEGDALKELPKLEGEFDFMFIDANKPDYFKYFKAVEGKLKKGAMVVADNAIQSANQMRDFLDYMKQSKDWEITIIRASTEKNDGMAVCYKVR